MSDKLEHDKADAEQQQRISGQLERHQLIDKSGADLRAQAHGDALVKRHHVAYKERGQRRTVAPRTRHKVHDEQHNGCGTLHQTGASHAAQKAANCNKRWSGGSRMRAYRASWTAKTAARAVYRPEENKEIFFFCLVQKKKKKRHKKTRTPPHRN